MKKLFKTGIAATLIAGCIFSNCFPIQSYLGEAAERTMLIQVFFTGTTVLYLSYALWKNMTQRTWIKIVLLLIILFVALPGGYMLTGFVVQPILLSTPWTFRLLADNESNIVWYWPLGISLITYMLYAGTKLFSKIIRGETILF